MGGRADLFTAKPFAGRISRAFPRSKSQEVFEQKCTTYAINYDLLLILQGIMVKVE